MPPCLHFPSRRVRDREAMPPCLRSSSLSPTRRGRDAPVRVRPPQFESRITIHGSSGRSARSGPPLCGGTPPATPPLYATVPALPQPPCPRPGGNAAVPAQFQPIANAPRTRRPRACAAPAVRITNHKSRITNHESRITAVPGASARPEQNSSSCAILFGDARKRVPKTGSPARPYRPQPDESAPVTKRRVQTHRSFA